ncbi:hypothetical protein BE04_11230 [Sorangium cellulosum]|uniref:TonB-dependent receptor-like beta-barrel domain-containing protein n=1 Tax=Sorangium cellulosum TaxID=56 RepID=A0A150PAP3_SORCE|nr:hypothetical protein BE04_11230 [Sorangium cellulosum]
MNAARTRGARIGIDATYDRATSEADVYDPAVLEKQPQPERYPTGSSMTHGGVYGQAEAELVHGLRAHAGVRQALFHLDIPKRSVDEDSSSPAFTNTMVDVVFNAGVRWEFAPGVAWIANAGRGVRSPNVQDFAALGPRAGNRFQIPNPDVGPEHTLSIDTGLKTLIDRISAEVAIFYLAYDDAIALAPAARDGSPTTPDGEQYEWSENASRVEYYGVEGEFDVPLARYAGISGRLLAMIGTQYNEQRTGLPAKTPADRAPPPQASVRVWAQPVPRLRIEATANGRLAQDRLNDPTNVEDNRIPENGTPGYVTLHLRGAFRVGNKITARLALDNLTDELVLEHGSGFYRPGFSATSSLDVSF